MGGGSGSSGQVGYPSYMETTHSNWLSIVELIIANGVAAASPYTAAVAYDPDSILSNNDIVMDQFNTLVLAFSPDSDWSTLWTVAQNKLETSVFSDTIINAKVAAYNANALARLNTDVLPRYQRGMQDVRAVMTSAFTIGEAIITSDITRDVNKFEADLKRDNEIKKNELISHATDGLL
jgi:hypothetical protein